MKNNFLRSASILVGGSALAQALAVVSLPVLTRLYSPDNFGLLVVYTSVVGIVSVAACLRLDIAIPVPKRDGDAANILVLALFSMLVVVLTTVIVINLFKGEILALFDHPNLEDYLWLVPIGILLNSTYSALQYWATRKKAFSLIARTRVGRAVGGITTQAGLGFFGYTSGGLIIGQMVNSGAGIFGLTRHVFTQSTEAFKEVNLGRMRHLLVEYGRYPKYSTFEALFNSASIQLPLILIAAMAVGSEAGYLMLSMKVMQAPMGMIGGAIAQVYLSRAPEEYRNQNLGVFTAKVLCGLLKTGVGPLFFVGFVAPQFFVIIFGSEWYRAGELLMWMTPWFVMQFLSSPISMALQVANHQKRALILQLVGLLLRVGSVIFAGLVSPAYLSEAYALSGFIFYAFFVLVVLVSVGCKIGDITPQLKKSFPVLLGWSVFSLCVLGLCLFFMD